MVVKKTLVLLLTFLVIILFGCSREKKQGCRDALAINFDKTAEEDDGSCTFETNLATETNEISDTVNTSYNPCDSSIYTEVMNTEPTIKGSDLNSNYFEAQINEEYIYYSAETGAAPTLFSVGCTDGSIGIGGKLGPGKTTQEGYSITFYGEPYVSCLDLRAAIDTGSYSYSSLNSAIRVSVDYTTAEGVRYNTAGGFNDCSSFNITSVEASKEQFKLTGNLSCTLTDEDGNQIQIKNAWFSTVFHNCYLDLY